jgi:hypothetical protein
MTEYKKGQKIRVSFETTVDRAESRPTPPGGHGFNFYTPGGTYIFVSPDQESFDKYTIEILDPENWPPQIGDVWEAEGADYYAKAYGYKNIHIGRFDNKTGGFSDSPDWARTIDKFKELSPVLVRRRSE